jgi:hypothetical protein
LREKQRLVRDTRRSARQSRASRWLNKGARRGSYLEGEAEAGEGHQEVSQAEQRQQVVKIRGQGGSFYLEGEAETGEGHQEVSQAEQRQQVVEHALHSPGVNKFKWIWLDWIAYNLHIRARRRNGSIIPLEIQYTSVLEFVNNL